MQETKKVFNHYKLHTQYSICEGAINIEDLEKFCKNNKINSIGISDTSNLCGVLQFSETVSKSKTQPIIGSQINFKHKLSCIKSLNWFVNNYSLLGLKTKHMPLLQ